ncbi:unnamed protein product [Caenorhabditis brenneri]
MSNKILDMFEKKNYKFKGIGSVNGLKKKDKGNGICGGTDVGVKPEKLGKGKKYGLIGEAIVGKGEVEISGGEEELLRLYGEQDLEEDSSVE